jgi:hypothetical protein
MTTYRQIVADPASITLTDPSLLPTGWRCLFIADVQGDLPAPDHVGDRAWSLDGYRAQCSSVPTWTQLAGATNKLWMPSQAITLGTNATRVTVGSYMECINFPDGVASFSFVSFILPPDTMPSSALDIILFTTHSATLAGSSTIQFRLAWQTLVEDTLIGLGSGTTQIDTLSDRTADHVHIVTINDPITGVNAGEVYQIKVGRDGNAGVNDSYTGDVRLIGFAIGYVSTIG